MKFDKNLLKQTEIADKTISKISPETLEKIQTFDKQVSTIDKQIKNAQPQLDILKKYNPYKDIIKSIKKLENVRKQLDEAGNFKVLESLKNDFNQLERLKEELTISETSTLEEKDSNFDIINDNEDFSDLYENAIVSSIKTLTEVTEKVLNAINSTNLKHEQEIETLSSLTSLYKEQKELTLSQIKQTQKQLVLTSELIKLFKKQAESNNVTFQITFILMGVTLLVSIVSLLI